MANEVKWTEEQKQAIYEKDSNILVAAAAGSVKKEELEEIFEAQETIETTCEFCNKKYEFTKEEVLG